MVPVDGCGWISARSSSVQDDRALAGQCAAAVGNQAAIAQISGSLIMGDASTSSIDKGFHCDVRLSRRHAYCQHIAMPKPRTATSSVNWPMLANAVMGGSGA